MNTCREYPQWQQVIEVDEHVTAILTAVHSPGHDYKPFGDDTRYEKCWRCGRVRKTRVKALPAQPA